MTFWLFACALVALVVVFTLLPMMRKAEEKESLDFARAFYRDRETELNAQLAAGEIDQAARDAALAEQGRRLLALAKATPETTGPEGTLRRRKLAALLMLLVVPVLGAGLYLRAGRPGMPDVPLAERKVTPRDFDVATAIERIEAHLAKNPNDARGFAVVAPVYMKAGRYADAARAWRRVIEIDGENAARLADLGEALVAAGEGVISAEARQAFEQALKLEADSPKVRYYLALALEQDGKKAEALSALEKLRDELGEGAARMRVVGEIARLKGEATGGALAELPEKEREQAIAAMVDGLEARLANGGTPDDWLKLIRARLVLGQKERALALVEKARQTFKDRPEAAELLPALDALVTSAR